MNRSCRLVALFTANWLLCGCGGDAKTDAPVPTLVVGHVGHDHQIALGVAMLEPAQTRAASNVYLQELAPGDAYRLMEGDTALAELRIRKVGGGSNMPKAMAAGAIDIGFGGIPPTILFIDKGSDIKILCPLNVDGDMLVVRPDFPAASWEAFVARVKASPDAVKIGYKAPVAIAKLIFEKACEAAGLTCASGGTGKAGEIELVNLQGEANALPAMESNAVHGVVINEPVGSLIAQKHAGRVVTLLSELPPDGMWKAHPCCCVCAREEIIAKHPAALRAFVKLIRAATGIINADKLEAAEIAHRWTKTDLEVEKHSVPNIVYTTRIDAAYRAGLDKWHALMAPSGTFTGVLMDLSPDEVFARVHDLGFAEEGR